ncbi:hypothetical protein Hdeb2414_s0363g00877341 [Helianthus debilis subsp. tardiflorus]
MVSCFVMKHGVSMVEISFVRLDSSTMEVDDNDDGCRRMVLDNMYACGYTSSTLEGHVRNPEAKRFYDMLKVADEPLWDGEKSTNCSKLQAITNFLTWNHFSTCLQQLTTTTFPW